MAPTIRYLHFIGCLLLIYTQAFPFSFLRTKRSEPSLWRFISYSISTHFSCDRVTQTAVNVSIRRIYTKQYCHLILQYEFMCYSCLLSWPLCDTLCWMT